MMLRAEQGYRAARQIPRQLHSQTAGAAQTNSSATPIPIRLPGLSPRPFAVPVASQPSASLGIAGLAPSSADLFEALNREAATASGRRSPLPEADLEELRPWDPTTSAAMRHAATFLSEVRRHVMLSSCVRDDSAGALCGVRRTRPT